MENTRPISELCLKIDGKHHTILIKPLDDHRSFLECTAASFSQNVQNVVLPRFLEAFPEKIRARKKLLKGARQSETVHIRMTPQDKGLLEEAAMKECCSVSEFVRMKTVGGE